MYIHCILWVVIQSHIMSCCSNNSQPCHWELFEVGCVSFEKSPLITEYRDAVSQAVAHAYAELNNLKSMANNKIE